jgi:hypothetical protein
MFMNDSSDGWRDNKIWSMVDINPGRWSIVDGRESRKPCQRSIVESRENPVEGRGAKVASRKPMGLKTYAGRKVSIGDKNRIRCRSIKKFIVGAGSDKSNSVLLLIDMPD